MRYFIILFFINSMLLFGQSLNTIEGRVTDKESGEPLYLANVFIKNTTAGATTNEKGIFTLKGNFNTGDILSISYVGYESKNIPVSQLNPEELNEIKLDNKTLSSQTVLIEGTIGKKGQTPVAFSKISREELKESYINQDIPEYLSYLPSTTFYSEGGAGVGYNYLSIRGFDQRRISIAVNGVPQNDPEDHNLYWLDLPDLLGSASLIQVQRGGGSGLIGYPAVGGSINIITSPFTQSPKLEVASTFGSYNFRKYEVSFSSGIINNKYSVYARLSNTLSSGYRNLNWIDFKSYHIAAIRYDGNFTTQLNVFGGPVADGLTYTGLPKFAIKDREERKKNFNYWEAENGEYTYTSVRRPEEKENFFQPHFEMLNEWNVNNNLTLNSALFLVIGEGFFDYDGSWAPLSYFRITPENGFTDLETDPDETYMPNTLIRAMVENTQYGWIPRVSYKHNNGELIGGLELRKHNSIHWGSIEYAQDIPVGLPHDYRYYYYEGGKDIINAYLHETYNLTQRINLLAEAQVSYFRYEIKNEKYLDNEFTLSDVFFNPKFGINYKFTPQLSAYVSAAMISREPRLKTYYDAAESSGGEEPQFEQNADGSYNFDKPLIKPETMKSVDVGTYFGSDNADLTLNLYYMQFDDEHVKEGRLDRFGQPVTGNMERTIHMGIEAAATYRFGKTLELTVNSTLSKNYIDEGLTYIETDNGVEALDLSGNRISGFPNFIANGIVKFNYDNLVLQGLMKYVGKFYSDNYDDNLSGYLAKYPGFVSYGDNVVESYFTANLMGSYEINIAPVFNSLKIYGQINNIFDNLYAAYAIGNEFFPAAERNYQIGIKAGF